MTVSLVRVYGQHAADSMRGAGRVEVPGPQKALEVLNLFEGSCDVDQLEQLETNDWTLVRGICLVTYDYRQTDAA
jgi:hypothetical protein